MASIERSESFLTNSKKVEVLQGVTWATFNLRKESIIFTKLNAGNSCKLKYSVSLPNIASRAKNMTTSQKSAGSFFSITEKLPVLRNSIIQFREN